MSDSRRRHPSWIPIDETVMRLIQAEAEQQPGWPDKQSVWGLALLTQGRHEEAAEAFGRALEINPHYAWAALNHIQASALAGDFRNARAELGALDKAPPAAVTLAACFVDLIEGQHQAGLQRLDAEPEAIRSRHDVRRMRAALLHDRDELSADAVWKQTFADLPKLDRSLAAPWDASGSVAARYLTLVPGLHQLWATVSTLLGRMGRVEESEQAAEVAYLVWAEKGSYLTQRAQLASLRGDDEDAQRLCTEAAEAAPRDPRPHVALAYHWSALGDLDRALASGAAALERAPRYPDLRYQMGLLLRASGRAADALEYFNRALEFNPRYTNALLAVARTLFDLERWSDAHDAYDRVIEAGLVSSDIYLHVGQIEEKLSRSDRAEAAFVEAMRLNPGDAEAYYLGGDLFRRLGNRDAARQAWTKFLELSHDPERVAEVEGRLKSA